MRYPVVLNSLISEIYKCQNQPSLDIQFQNIVAILDTTTFLCLICPKLTKYVKVQFHIELIRYRADSIVKSKIHEIGILSDQTLSNGVA